MPSLNKSHLKMIITFANKYCVINLRDDKTKSSGKLKFLIVLTFHIYWMSKGTQKYQNMRGIIFSFFSVKALLSSNSVLFNLPHIKSAIVLHSNGFVLTKHKKYLTLKTTDWKNFDFNSDYFVWRFSAISIHRLIDL